MMNAISDSRRDCFDRFGDDLLSLMTGFLPFEHKIRLECVSKRWQRCVFNRQNQIFVTHDHTIHHKHSVSELVSTSDFVVNESLFESLLKKCVFINEVSIDQKCKINDKILDIISENCQYLKSFKCRVFLTDIKSETLVKFAEKFGSTLETINAFGVNRLSMTQMLNNLSKIKSVYYLDVHHSTDFNVYKQIVANLEEVSLVYLSDDEFKLFANQYRNQIKSLTLRIHRNARLEALKKNLFSQLSRFKKLEKLILHINDNQCEKFTVNDGLKLLGSECVNLSKMKLINPTDSFESVNYRFVNFSSLTKLYLARNFFDGRLDCFDGCSRLTHLSLNVLYFNEDIMLNIAPRLPNLISLRLILSKIKSLSDLFLRTITKFSKLQELMINRSVDYYCNNKATFTDTGICALIFKCKHLRVLSILSKCRMTVASVNAFQERAKLNSRMHYKFTCSRRISDAFISGQNNFDVCCLEDSDDEDVSEEADDSDSNFDEEDDEQSNEDYSDDSSEEDSDDFNDSYNGFDDKDNSYYD